jgi:hypothetical protein
MITAVLHTDTHGTWATIDEVPNYSAACDGDTMDLMALVKEAADIDFFDLHDDDLRWRVCGRPDDVVLCAVRGAGWLGIAGTRVSWCPCAA